MNSNAQLAQGPQAQLPTGPQPVPKQRPALAQLREALTALHIGGLCRTVAYELLTYWSPGGAVFPSVKTMADDMGLKPRVVRHHIARLERVGLWVRIGRKGQTNLYALHLPGEAQEGFVQPSPRHTRAAPPGTHVPPKCSLEVLRAPSGRSAAYSKNGAVRTPGPGKPAPPLEAVAAPPSVDEGLQFLPHTGGEPGPNQQAFLGKLKTLRKGARLRRTTTDSLAKNRAGPSLQPSPDNVGGYLDGYNGGTPDTCPKCGHDRIYCGACPNCGADLRDFGDDFNHGH